MRVTPDVTVRSTPRSSGGRFAITSLTATAVVAGMFIAPPAQAHDSAAADPSEGSVSLQEPTLTWQGEHYAVGSTVIAGLPCDAPENTTCDHFDLHVDVDPAHWESHDGGVEVVISWPDPEDDFDLRVYDDEGTLLGSSTSASSNLERVFVPDAAGTYEVVVNPWQVTDSGYTGHAGLTSTKKKGKQPAPGGEVPDEPLYDVPCDEGLAGPFPCENVDLASYLPLSEIGATDVDLVFPNRGNDIWGWTDPETGREYALMGTTSGTAFVDITEPTAPVFLGQLPSAQPVRTIFRQWADVKVYENHAYVVSEEPLHGMQVFDLTRLRGVSEPRTWDADAHYTGFNSAHNVAIDTESGYAYAIGTDTCDGGPHIIDLAEPASPAAAGCVDEDGYTHDTQAVTYDGPDTRYTGRELLFNSNEDTVTIVDVTDKANPVQLSRFGYEGAQYTHQGWLTEDSRFFLFNDELDEQNNGHNTTTYLLDVTDLENPHLHGTHVHDTPAIDHNLYTKDGTVYEANYRAGLRVLSTRPINGGKLREVGYFDVYPADDAAEFNGAWSNYPYFDSGTVVVSGIEQGLFVLKPTGAAS